VRNLVSFNFPFQSPLTHPDFEMQQNIGNLKHAPGATMTDLRLDSDISPIPPLILQSVKSMKRGLTLAFRAL